MLAKRKGKINRKKEERNESVNEWEGKVLFMHKIEKNMKNGTGQFLSIWKLLENKKIKYCILALL